MGGSEKWRVMHAQANGCIPRHLAYLPYFFLLLQVVFVRRLELEKAELQVLWSGLCIRNVVLEARIGVGPPLDVLGCLKNTKFLS